MPSKQTFHFELRDIICQFEDFLNEIIIRRYNANREVQDRIKIPLLWGHKQRVLHDMINKQEHITLPLIAVCIGGIKRDKERVFNKHEGHYVKGLSGDDYAHHWLQPVPVDITMKVSIMTRYQIDMDQIITNFVPYTDPYIVISWPWPDPLTGKIIEIRSAVIWNEDIQMEYPEELDKSKPLRFIADTTFTIKGWLFKNSPNIVKTIYRIDHDFTAVNRIYDNYQLMADMEFPNINVDTIYVSARPFIQSITPYVVDLYDTPEVVVIGSMMDYVTGVYVSGSEGIFDNVSAYFPVSGNSSIKVSGLFLPFSGVMIPTSSWEIVDKTMLKFTMPPPLTAGNIDVIVVNEAGYGQLIKDTSSIAPTITSFRFPYEKGISAVDLTPQ